MFFTILVRFCLYLGCFFVDGIFEYIVIIIYVDGFLRSDLFCFVEVDYIYILILDI